jgi:hypothetical protein
MRQDWDDLQGLESCVFAIVMTSIVDLALQNPVTSSEADTPITRPLPALLRRHAGGHRRRLFPHRCPPGTCSSSRRSLPLPLS